MYFVVFFAIFWDRPRSKRKDSGSPTRSGYAATVSDYPESFADRPAVSDYPEFFAVPLVKCVGLPGIICVCRTTRNSLQYRQSNVSDYPESFADKPAVSDYPEFFTVPLIKCVQYYCKLSRDGSQPRLVQIFVSDRCWTSGFCVGLGSPLVLKENVDWFLFSDRTSRTSRG